MNFLLLVHVFITLALIGVILLQKSDGGGLGLGGGGGSAANMFTARGAANLLTRITAVLAALFMGNCLLMTVIASHQVKHASSIIEAPQPAGAHSQVPAAPEQDKTQKTEAPQEAPKKDSKPASK